MEPSLQDYFVFITPNLKKIVAPFLLKEDDIIKHSINKKTCFVQFVIFEWMIPWPWCRYNILFLLSGAGKYNYQGTRRWIEDQLDSSGRLCTVTCKATVLYNLVYGFFPQKMGQSE
jgi:hypothetical protein